MFGILLFCILMLLFSWLFANPSSQEQLTAQATPQYFPEDVFTIIDEVKKNEEFTLLNDYLENFSVEEDISEENVVEPIVSETISCPLPTKKESDSSPLNYLKKQKMAEIRTACSVLKRYGFINKSQKLSGKGITKALLLNRIETALQQQKANNLLADYLQC